MHSLPINLLLLFFTFGVLLDTRAAAPAIGGLGSSQNWLQIPCQRKKTPTESRGLIQKHFVEPLLYSDMEYHVHDRHIKHYSNFHQILLVGEGDFSFSLSLANAFGSAENMVATSLNSREKLLQFYNSAHETLSKLERLGALVLHGVDVTTMEEHHIIRKMKFHRIVYNFPHAGFCGQEDHSTVINQHRLLLKMFFKNAKTMVSEIGEIHVTHKEKDPYNKWELVKQAEECGLLLKESVNFTKEDYPGYVNRRGAPPKAGGTFFLGECRTYKFVLCPDILYKREIMAIQAENFHIAILEPELPRQVTCPRMSGEMAEENAETSVNYLKMLADKEFARQRISTLHQTAQTWRVKATTAEQLDAALELKDDAFKRKETILEEAISELQSESQARKNAEREEAGRLKMQKGMMPLFVSSSVAFALFLFLKCRKKN